MKTYLAVVAAVVAAGCGDQVLFTCNSDTQCVIGTMKGQCVSGGCAFAASDCASGLRYHSSAPRGGECVPTNDGGANDLSVSSDDGPPAPVLSDLSHVPTDGGCPSGQHVCSAACVDDTSTTTCGTACVACGAQKACINGACISVANLLLKRANHAAVLGPDGHVYVLGGANPDVGTLSSVSVFDSGTNAWIDVAQMSKARQGFGAVTGADGRIYAMGGSQLASQILPDVEAYSPAMNKWVSVAPLPHPRRELAAVAGQDGRIYAIGGYDVSLSNVVEAYSPATNAWTAVAPMPTARSQAVATLAHDGRIFVIGGFDGTNAIDVVEAFDPATNKWSTAPAWPRPRNNPAAATGPDGKLYVFGGFTYGNTIPTTYSGHVDVFDPNTSTWSVATEMPTPRTALAAVTGADRLIYAIGGNDQNAYLATVEAYSTASNSW